MKVLISGEQLEGKKIVYCGIENMGDIDGTMIITEDSEVLMFNYTGDNFEKVYKLLNEKDIKRLLIMDLDTSIERTLLEYNVITEEELEQIQKEHVHKTVERMKKEDEVEYQKYLKLKEKFEGK